MATAFTTAKQAVFASANFCLRLPRSSPFHPSQYRARCMHFGYSVPFAGVRYHLKLLLRTTLDDQTSIGIPNCLDSDGSTVPTPIVIIDQDSDPTATVVEISFGDRLGALVDTMNAMMMLGLDVSKASVSKEASLTRTKFFLRRLDNDRKIEDPELLEKIRLTIISNLLKYHPESSECLAMGEAFGLMPPKKLNVDVSTHIHIEDDGHRSILYVETADRPGLLLELMKIMIDSNVNVDSAEIDTEGLVAKDRFYVSYQGAALKRPVAEVLVNSLRYYLRRPDTDIDSY